MRLTIFTHLLSGSFTFMKMKKITALTVAIIAIIAAFAIIPSVKTVAHASEEPAAFVQGFDSYENSEIVKKVFGISDVKDLGEGTYYFAYAKAGETEEIEKDISVSSGKTTIFSAAGNYKMTVYSKDGETRTNLEDRVDVAFKVIDKSEIAEDSTRYAVDAAKINEYYGEKDSTDKNTVYGALNNGNKKLGDSFTYPDMDKLIVSDYFNYSEIKGKLTLNYSQPKSASFSSTSSKSFKLNAIGTYCFYITCEDASLGAKIVINKDEHERKVVDDIDGWYVKDTDELVCPIFSFEFSAVKQPEITLEKPEKCFVGLLYKGVSSAITVVATNESKKYSLYFSDKNLAQAFQSANSDKNWNDDGIDYVKANAVEIKEDAAEKFNTSTLNFTPQKKGFYYVVCEVADDYGKVAVVTDPFVVVGEYEKVVYEKEFLKYNWVSLVFGGIAILCAIGLVVLLLVKPKDKTAEESDVVPTAKK